MAFVPKPNTGTLWPNDKRTQDTHPNARGDIFIDKQLVKQMLEQAEDGLVQFSISAWTKELAGKRAMTLKISEPYRKAEPKPVSDEPIEDIPF